MTAPSSRTQLPPAYEPKEVEGRIYEMWREAGYFQPRGAGNPYCIIMPPPNLTGELHMGHALTTAIEDSLTRWHRMLGDDTLWQPGVDHAAIAVNAIIERDLAREGISRHDIGREEFLNRTWEFVRKSRSRIAVQHRRLGASADWSREAFTMDGEREVAVRRGSESAIRLSMDAGKSTIRPSRGGMVFQAVTLSINPSSCRSADAN